MAWPATDTQTSHSSLDTAHLPINRSRDNTNPLIYVSLLTPDPRRDLWKLFKCKSDKNEMVSILVKSSVSGLSNLQIEQIYEVLGDVACTGSTGVCSTGCTGCTGSCARYDGNYLIVRPLLAGTRTLAGQGQHNTEISCHNNSSYRSCQCKASDMRHAYGARLV